MMEQAMQVFMDYAAAFEQTYVDDDWLRLTPFFSKDASYEVRGGPLACKISGREAIFAGLKKSIDGLDRRCADRKIELTDGPEVVTTDAGQTVSLGWRVDYQYKDAPPAGFPGRSVVTILGGVIVALRDEYDDEEMERFSAWMREHGEGLDGSYV
jgi:hypothetical protein